jgi:DNA-binding CsgD family transcriptional regulator
MEQHLRDGGYTVIGEDDEIPPGAELVTVSAACYVEPREMEILERLANRRPTGEIARTLGMTVREVNHQIQRLMAKLGAATPADLVKVAQESGLVGGKQGA